MSFARVGVLLAATNDWLAPIKVSICKEEHIPHPSRDRTCDAFTRSVALPFSTTTGGCRVSLVA